MSLAKDYCKEIIKELDKIPVFLPGTPVAVGDIITFGRGWFSRKPIGAFDPVSKLSNLGISVAVQEDNAPDPYLYASRGDVGVSFTADANAATVGNGKLDISFNKEGATYFAAINCKVRSMIDVAKLKNLLAPHRDKIDWKNCYIVTSVTIADRALIMQSNSKNANLTIEGNVKGLQPGGNLNVDASAAITIKNYKDSSFIKDWSDNVTVFFTLAKYRKKIFGDWEIKSRSSMLTNLQDDSIEFELNPVYTEDLIFE